MPGQVVAYEVSSRPAYPRKGRRLWGKLMSGFFERMLKNRQIVSAMSSAAERSGSQGQAAKKYRDAARRTYYVCNPQRPFCLIPKPHR